MTNEIRKAPSAEKRPVEITCHGETRTDDYAWLKDENWQRVMKQPGLLGADIRGYLEAENAYAKAWMADTETLQEALFQEMRGRIKEDDVTVPQRDGAFSYYIRYVEGGQHPKYCRMATDGDETETVILDGDVEAEGRDFYKVGNLIHSPDHKCVAFAEDLAGSEIYRVRFRDLATGADLEDTLVGTGTNMVWAEDGQTLFYAVLDENHRPSRVLRHRLGTDPTRDEVVYEESDPGFFVSVGKTESRRFILIDTSDHITSEVRLIPADAPGTAPRLVSPRETGVEYSVAEHDGRLVILTNADGALDFKIVTASVEAPGRDNWEDFVVHTPGRLIVGLAVFERFLVRMERVDALVCILVHEWQTAREYPLRFDEEAYALNLDRGFEYETDTLRYGYSSPTTPRRIFDFDMASGERILRKEDEVPSGHDPSSYVTRRIHAVASDGESVLVTILYKKGARLDGSAPLMLYGYGSYGMAMPAAFSPARLSLVDRGFIYAVAHIRGGTEKGYSWYTAGKAMAKHNTFTDFIASAEGLIAANLAHAGNIAIHGRSAGGMLVGACTNMRPDLWRAVVANVPFVDVLNTMCDSSLPLTPIEWPEWGNPIEDPAAYRYIQSYSPYDNIEAKTYPAILATAGLTDPRVTYWEPAKWVAKLRALKTDTNPLLLKTNMSAGHAGSAGRFDQLKESAFDYAFVLKVFGIEQ